MKLLYSFSLLFTFTNILIECQVLLVSMDLKVLPNAAGLILMAYSSAGPE